MTDPNQSPNSNKTPFQSPNLQGPSSEQNDPEFQRANGRLDNKSIKQPVDENDDLQGQGYSEQCAQSCNGDELRHKHGELLDNAGEKSGERAKEAGNSLYTLSDEDLTGKIKTLQEKAIDLSDEDAEKYLKRGWHDLDTAYLIYQDDIRQEELRIRVEKAKQNQLELRKEDTENHDRVNVCFKKLTTEFPQVEAKKIRGMINEAIENGLDKNDPRLYNLMLISCKWITKETRKGRNFTEVDSKNSPKPISPNSILILDKDDEDSKLDLAPPSNTNTNESMNSEMNLTCGCKDQKIIYCILCQGPYCSNCVGSEEDPDKFACESCKDSHPPSPLKLEHNKLSLELWNPQEPQEHENEQSSDRNAISRSERENEEKESEEELDENTKQVINFFFASYFDVSGSHNHISHEAPRVFIDPMKWKGLTPKEVRQCIFIQKEMDQMQKENQIAIIEAQTNVAKSVKQPSKH